ncbi:YihY/virulence factor BrkB family protein [Proteocatella sphenisci]|uniref:YihY/virulence factor BrkB family protein n=1 Tax=Proteocatella sphenisci TaxID=181070 RepID=UPI00048D21FE|nr:YihY/virulence factor BrkB family protein [Proteocatella sphenisci]
MKKNNFSFKYMYPHKDDPVVFYAVKALYGRYTDDNLSQLGGQLAYFFILSIFPMLMLISQIVGILYIDTAELSFVLSEFLPPNVLDIVFDYLQYASDTKSTGIFTFSAISSVFIASKALTSIIYALNKAYRVDVLANNIQKQILAFVGTLSLVFALILSLVLITVGKPLFYDILEFFRLDTISLQAWTIFRWSVSLSTLFLTLYLVYFIIPVERIPRRYNVTGTLFTMISLLTMSLGFAYYVNNFSKHTIIYGSLGTVMLLLLYLYFSGIIIVLGGELIHILYHRSIGNYEFDVK